MGTIGRLGVRPEPHGGHAVDFFTAGDGQASQALFLVEDGRVQALAVAVDDRADPVRFARGVSR